MRHAIATGLDAALVINLLVGSTVVVGYPLVGAVEGLVVAYRTASQTTAVNGATMPQATGHPSGRVTTRREIRGAGS